VAGGAVARPSLRPVDVATLRSIAGHFGTGVTVVTASDEDGPVGFTCQAFASLSLDPPLVLFCPALSSASYSRAREVGAFCVNILAEDQEVVARTFAQSGVDKFSEVAHTLAPNGAPIIGGVLAWIACELVAEHDGGDHRITVCRVSALGQGPARRPLGFYRGGFGTFAS
jgi:3-hydroxy-9,10-secoandrosta-1,3,5(10)-triene-9,17-dione monooxygenase reductase component